MAACQFHWHEKLRRRKKKRRKRGRAKIPGGRPLSNPLPFCPPELKSFSKFSVRVFAKKSSDFIQGVEPNWMIRVHRLGASPLGGQIGKNFPRLFGFKANRLRAQNVVRRAKRGVNENLQPILFLPPKAESKAIIFSPKAI